jgi:hypothetical protein
MSGLASLMIARLAQKQQTLLAALQCAMPCPNRSSRHVLALGILLAGLAGSICAAEPVLMRSSLANPEPVWVGQRVTIKVALLTTTFFADAPAFQLPTIPHALLMQIEDHPVLGTEQIDATAYNVQQHELALFMLRPGVYTVPPFTVRFASTPHYGEPPVEHQLTTQAMQVEARMPPGAEHLPSLISSRDLRVTQTWQPQPTQARLGDAFTRTITLSAPDVPGMVLPPLPLTQVDGLTVYPKPPVVQDQVERGTFTGQRMQTVTYVCERPGPITVPALIIPWWDAEKQTLRQATLPALTLKVVAPHRGWPWWSVGVVLGLAAGAGLCWHKRRAWRAAWERRQTQRLASEAGCFARLHQACRAGDAVAAYNALLRWLDCTHSGPGSATLADDLLAHHPSVELQRHVEALQAVVLQKGYELGWHGPRRSVAQGAPGTPAAAGVCGRRAATGLESTLRRQASP